MTDLLALSARLIDDGGDASEAHRFTLETHELAEGIALTEAFSHLVTFRTDDGLVVFDVSLDALGTKVRDSLRGWDDAAVRTIVYTHGHRDHVGGAPAFLAEADDAGRARPEVIGHHNVAARFDRYDLTAGLNGIVNARQFGDGGGMAGGWPTGDAWVRPTTTVDDELHTTVGGLELHLHHALGETDDHLWAWVPEHRAAVVGDFFIWAFPNAGNPQKVQRYPTEWARALRDMAACEPELLLPAHGLPIAGRDRIARVLDDVASALETLVESTLALMNEGAPLDEIVHSVRLPDELLARPYLSPIYDDPEFTVRNIWRRYGGWYDGNPARLLPPPDAAVATETAALAGGVEVLVARARELADAGDLRLAAHLVELAARAAPDDRSAHAARAEIYERRRKAESSLMAKGIFGHASRESAAIAGGDDAVPAR